MLQHGKSRPQNFHIPAKFIDDQPADTRPFVLIQQSYRTVQLGKHSAAVNIPDQQYGRIDQLCQPHINDVISLQVDFCRAACPLNNQNVIFLRKAFVGTQNIGNQLFLMAEIFPRGHVTAHLTVDNDLAAHITAGFQQNGVHPHIRLNTGSLGLYHLGTSHFQPITRHKAVQRHVLALERGDPVAVLRKNTAKRRTQQAFARTAHRALHHDTFCLAHASTSFIRRSSCRFSLSVRTAVRYQVSSSPA